MIPTKSKRRDAADIAKTQNALEESFKAKERAREGTDERGRWEAQLEAARGLSNPELRAREESYATGMLVKLDRARAEREKELQVLKDADTRRRQEDARLRGYQASGLFTHALPLRNAHESQAEMVLEQNLIAAGEATGEAWVRTDDGLWARKHNPVMEQKSLLSEHELSTQAYEAVDFGFGLRRSRSWDYVLAVSCVTVLVRKYCALGARSLQNSLYRDVRVTMKTFLRFPQAIEAVMPLLKECVDQYDAVRAARVGASMPVTVDDERLEQLNLWVAQIANERVRRSGAKQAAAIAAARMVDPAGEAEAESDESMWYGFANLPHELLLKIFGRLTMVRDVVRVTAVCTRWYDSGNDDHLYRQLLIDEVPPEELVARYGKVKSFKTVYMQVHSKLVVPMTGLYICSACDELFWAGKNVGKHCRREHDFVRHEPGVVMTPSTLVQGLLAAWGKQRFGYKK